MSAHRELNEIYIEPVIAPVDADVLLPGSKSYTNRALVLGALADGRTTIDAALFSDDTHYMADSLRRLGIAVEEDPDAKRFTVDGAGGRIPEASADLFVGNSGTTARFITALVALGNGVYHIDGVERMHQRPIAPLITALQQLDIDATALNGDGCPPLRIATQGFSGGTARLAGNTSSQYFSALLMIGGIPEAGLRIDVDGDLVSKPYIDMTAATMRAFGVEMSHESYVSFCVRGGQTYRAIDYQVEPDASAASYFFALAAATGGRIRVRNLGVKSGQGDAHFVDILEQMGCSIVREDDALEVRGPAKLRGIDVDMNAISDTVQTLAAIAPLASEPVTLRNVAHIRHKETDRIRAVVTELRRLGVDVRERDDGLTIVPSAIRPARVETYDDHRMAMSFAILGCATPGITIRDPGCVAKTFPDFFNVLEQVVRPH